MYASLLNLLFKRFILWPLTVSKNFLIQTFLTAIPAIRQTWYFILSFRSFLQNGSSKSIILLASFTCEGCNIFSNFFVHSIIASINTLLSDTQCFCFPKILDLLISISFQSPVCKCFCIPKRTLFVSGIYCLSSTCNAGQCNGFYWNHGKSYWKNR